ncbi:MAG: NTP transferase domain-containing protein [Armatimonadota bacterium]|nr:MAG: NTP transferase domain-containing protein [Armatimonadota bacterium]
MLNAVILAAGRSGDDFGRTFGTVHKCLVKVAGRSMIHWVLDALRGASSVDRVVVVGPEGPLRSAGVKAQLVHQDGGAYTDSLHAGVGSVSGDKVLVIAADVPLLLVEGLDEYVTDCLASGADVCFPAVSWEAMQARFPGARKTWYDLRDGKLTKGNAVIGPRDFFLTQLSRIEGLFESRKKKRWAGLICQQFMRRLLARAASQADVEAMLSSYLRVRLKAVPADPSLAVDVDEVPDVAFVEAVLRQRVADSRTAVIPPMLLRESTQVRETFVAAVH